MSAQKRKPWMVKSDEYYIERGGWELYADYENWLISQMSDKDNAKEIYDGIDEIFKTELYCIMNRLFDSAASGFSRKSF